MTKKRGNTVILPDSELQIMQIIWDMAHDNNNDYSAITAGAMLEYAPERIGHLKLTTILTLITRLINKGCLSSEKSARANYYIPLITEEEYRQNAASNFVETVYKNDAKSLISALLGDESLSKDDIAEIRSMILNDNFGTSK